MGWYGGARFPLLAKRMRPSGEREGDKPKNQDDALYVNGLPMELIEHGACGT